MGNKPVERIFKHYDSGEYEEARKILSENAKTLTKEEVNRKFEEKNGKTLLRLFVEKGDLQMTKLLMSNPHLDLNNVIREEIGEENTALTYAVEKGNLEMIHMFLNDKRTDVNKKVLESYSKTKSPLKKALDTVQADVVKVLMSHPGIHTEPIEYSPKRSGLVYTAQKGNLEIFKLFAEGKSMRELNGTYSSCPLHHAAFFGHIEIVKYLVEEKDVNYRRSSTLGNLLDICHRRNLPGIRAYIVEVSNRPAKLISACEKGDVGMVKDILSRKGRPVINEVVKNRCALLATCETRNDEVLDILLACEGLDVVTCNALNVLCDGSKGELNCEMITKLLNHRDASKCVSKLYENKKFKSVDTLGLLCFYGSEKNLDHIRTIVREHKGNNLNPHQTLKDLDMYEGEKTAPRMLFQGIMLPSPEDPKANMSYLGLTIWMKKWPIYEELLKMSSSSSSASTSSEVEVEPIRSRFSPLSSFLHVLPKNAPQKEEERLVTFEMFQKYVADPVGGSELFAMKSKIGNSEFTDPFKYVVRHLFEDNVVCEVLSHPQFQMKDEYLANKEGRDVGLFRELVRRGHCKSVEHFITKYYESLRKSLEFENEDEEERFWNLMVCDSPNVSMRKVLIDFHWGRKEELSKVEEMYCHCHLSELEKAKEAIVEDEEGELVNSEHQRLTPLSIAVKHRDIELFKILLAHPKIDVNKQFDILEYGESPEEDAEPFTPLQYACTNGFEGTMLLPTNVEIVKMLMEREEIDVLSTANESPPAIFMACMSHAPLEVIDLLLAPPHGPPCEMSGQYVLEKKTFPDVKTNILAVTLCQAWNMKVGDAEYEEYELEIVRRILSRDDFDVNELTGFPGILDGVHVLVLAGRMGKFAAVKEILKHKDVDVNLGRPTPLQACAEVKAQEFMSRIVSHQSFDETQIVLGLEGGLKTEEERKNFIASMVEIRKKLDGEVQE